MRARMKPGFRSIVLPGCVLAPEHPTYWTVPESVSAAVDQLVEDGQVEYEPSFARGAGGLFAQATPVPELALQVVEAQPAPRPAPPAPSFARKGSKGR